jgi:hypothetical protein
MTRFILSMALGAAHASGESFTYQANPSFCERRGEDLVVTFRIRKAGEGVTMLQCKFSGSSRWNALLIPLQEKDDLEYTYFELAIDQELIPAITKMLPRTDIVTKETLRDIAGYSNRVTEGSGSPFVSISESQIQSLKVITQNQFLNVTPRIIKVPAEPR